MEFKISDVIAKFKSGDLSGIDDKLVEYIERETAGKGIKDNQIKENELQTFLDAIDGNNSGTISDKELNEFLGTNSEGKEIKASIDKVLSDSKIPLEKEKISSLEGKPGVKKEDDGDYYVNVQKWKSTPVEGNQKANDCIWNIWTNYFKGSVDWETFQKEVMTANPKIFGTDDNSKVDDEGKEIKRGSRTGERIERWIYDGEKIYLPVHLLEKIDKPKEDDDKPKTRTEKGPEGTVEVTENKNGTVQRVYKNTAGKKVKTEMLDDKGRQTKEVEFDPESQAEKKTIVTKYNDDGSKTVTITELRNGSEKITTREIDKNGVIQSEKVGDEQTIKDGKYVVKAHGLNDNYRTAINKEMQTAQEELVDIASKLLLLRASLKNAKTRADFNSLMSEVGTLADRAGAVASSLNTSIGKWNKEGECANLPEFKSYTDMMQLYIGQATLRKQELLYIQQEIEAKIDELPSRHRRSHHGPQATYT